MSSPRIEKMCFFSDSKVKLKLDASGLPLQILLLSNKLLNPRETIF